jgi:hypothetical protein
MLSEDQKRLHDWDLREMDDQFEQIHDNFDKMKQGLPVDNPLFPEQEPKADEPPRPRRPRVIPKAPPPVVESGEQDVFDNYVQKFIKDYKLDAGQKATALSILKEYKAYADAYRKVKNEDYEKAKKAVEDARKENDIEKLKAAEKEIDKLNERISELLEQMKNRLMTIPRESQKRAYQEQSTKEPEREADKGGQDTPKESSNEPKEQPPDPKSTSPSRG